MSEVKNFFDGDPDFVNEEGVKWWLDKSMTKYAHRKDMNSVSLPDHQVWVVDNHGEKTRVILLNDKVIYESSSLEAIACRIDIEKRLRLP